MAVGGLRIVTPERAELGCGVALVGQVRVARPDREALGADNIVRDAARWIATRLHGSVLIVAL